MKKVSILLLNVLSLIVLSCESSSTTEYQPPHEEITDDFKLLTVNSEGGVFEIGNNSGQTTQVGQIASQANLLQLSTICNIDTKIYAVEASYEPAPNTLTIYDKETEITNTVQLALPASVTSDMMDPFISNLEYNGSALIAVVNENMPNDSRPNKIVSINLQNYEVTDLEISFFQRGQTSTALVNNKLYIATRTAGLLKVDLTDKSVTEVLANGLRINETRLTKINNSRIALMKLTGSGLVNGVKPFEYNIDNNTFTDKSAGETFSVGNITGNSVFYNGEYFNIVSKTGNQFGLLKSNSATTRFVALNYNVLNGNAIIVDVID